MSVTVSYRISGDVEKAKKLKAFGFVQLQILQNAMDFMRLQQDIRTVFLSDGSCIRCSSNFGTNVIEIYCPVIGKVAKTVTEEFAETYIRLYLVSATVSYTAVYRIDDKITRLSTFSIAPDPYEHKTPWSPTATTEWTVENCNTVFDHYATVSADNYWLASNHKSDWHYKDFLWVSFPYWESGTSLSSYENTWQHPSIAPGPKYHWNISTATDGSNINRHILRGIDHHKRLYRPCFAEYRTDTGVYMSEELMQRIYGKTHWAKEDKTLSRIRERVYSSGAASISYPVYPKMWAMYLFPFAPYLWEIPGFAIFKWTPNEPLYGQSMTPETGIDFKNWRYAYYGIDGVEHTSALFTDSGSFSDGSTGSSYTEPRPEIWEWVDGFPHPKDGASGSWTDTSNASSNWSADLIKYNPIGTVSGKVLSIRNALAINGSSTTASTSSYSKNTTMPDVYYTWRPISPNYFWGTADTVPCVFSEVDTANITNTKSQSVTGVLVSQIRDGDTVLVAGGGTMTFTAGYTEQTNYNGTTKITVTVWHQPVDSNEVESDGYGSRSDSTSISSVVERNLVLLDVLDYNSEPAYKAWYQHEDYWVSMNSRAIAFVYKEITLTHNITRTIGKSAVTSEDAMRMFQLGRISASPGVDFNPTGVKGTETSSDTITSSGQRIVNYYLYFGIPELNISYKKLLATCTTTDTTCTGERCYGIEVKFHNNVLYVTYDLEEFIAGKSVPSIYDAAINYEDWYTNGAGEKIWKNKARMLYIRTFNERKKEWMELLDQHEPINDEYYGLGIKDIDTKTTIVGSVK